MRSGTFITSGWRNEVKVGWYQIWTPYGLLLLLWNAKIIRMKNVEWKRWRGKLWMLWFIHGWWLRARPYYPLNNPWRLLQLGKRKGCSVRKLSPSVGVVAMMVRSYNDPFGTCRSGSKAAFFQLYGANARAHLKER